MRLLAACSAETSRAFDAVADAIYSDSPTLLGWPNADTGQFSSYYPDSPDLTANEIRRVQERLATAGFHEFENTRLRKVSDANQVSRYELLIASAEVYARRHTGLEGTDFGLPPIVLCYGDHSAQLGNIIESLDRARHYTSNRTQSLLLEEYVKHFQSGSIEASKHAQKLWVEDKSPTVESLLGFIEYYRDPSKVRAEWRGFVMIQSTTASREFASLVEHAHHC